MVPESYLESADWAPSTPGTATTTKVATAAAGTFRETMAGQSLAAFKTGI